MSKPLEEIVAVMARAMLEAHGNSIRWAFIAGGEEWRLFEPHARAALAALEKERYVVVPVDPTEAMIEAADCGDDGLNARRHWDGMIDARPRHGIPHPQAPYMIDTTKPPPIYITATLSDPNETVTLVHDAEELPKVES